MTKKKNKSVIEKTKPEIVPVDQEPQPEIPEYQIEEKLIENQVEQPSEAKLEPEKTTTIEPAKIEPQAESTPPKSEPEPIVEVSASKSDAKPAVEAPAPKPKPLNLASLHEQIEELEKKYKEQFQLITQLLEGPVRQRKPVASNGGKQVKDTATGLIYKSQNAAYRALLASGELKELVSKGIFGPTPEKNNWGCFQMFRSFPGRFEEIHAEVKDASTDIPQA